LFEHPLGLLWGLLIIPWALWARRERPATLRVGGLGPFLASAASGAKRRQLPPSWWCGVLALCAIALALGGFSPVPNPVIQVLDRSPSHLLWGTPAAGSPSTTNPKVVQVEGVDGIVLEEQLREALESVSGQRIQVFTDLPRPDGIPSTFAWNQAVREGKNAAIHAVLPHAEGGLEVHWIRGGVDMDLTLFLNGLPLSDLEGKAGTFHLQDGPPGAELSLLTTAGHPLEDDQSGDDGWVLREPWPLVLPKASHAGWEDAVRALWPWIQVERRPQAGTTLPGDGRAWPDLWLQEPSLALLADLRQRADAAGWFSTWVRPLAECLPPAAAGVWPDVWRSDVSKHPWSLNWVLLAMGLWGARMGLLSRKR